MRFSVGRPAAISVAVASVAALAAGLFPLAGMPAAVASPAHRTGIVITTANTAFGRALVVGSGQYTGFSLYFITSDHGRHFGCPARPVRTPIGKLLCTGPSGDRRAEWPAITTSGRLRAAGGVKLAHLGTVRRARVGLQITYYGHPLYLFGPGPGQVTGEGFNEPALPPWHGVWYLLSRYGTALPWPGALTTVTIGGRKILAAPMLTRIGWLSFPLYRYSRDVLNGGTTACTGACARLFPPVLTSGYPGVSSTSIAQHVGTFPAPTGTQVAYAGHPLYLFSGEVIVRTRAGYKAIGSGNDVRYRGGTFRYVTL
jgi:predicted lipoprotein with Yx(FWY)xxD motif